MQAHRKWACKRYSHNDNEITVRWPYQRWTFPEDLHTKRRCERLQILKSDDLQQIEVIHVDLTKGRSGNINANPHNWVTVPYGCERENSLRKRETPGKVFLGANDWIAAVGG
jgi:hypothetical protein